MSSVLSYDAFLRIVKQNFNSDHAILLGSGASITSGVPSAEECIWEWKRDIFISNNLEKVNRFKDFSSPDSRSEIQKWIDCEGQYLPENHPDEYSFFAELAYPLDDARRKYFENKLLYKEPYIGYKILCLLSQLGMIRIVFTTNFDGLLVKATHLLKGIVPIEISLDSTNLLYQPSTKNRLLYVSLHGDFRYTKLKNTSTELDVQHEEFEKALSHHLTDKHLIVIGYSGRDKSLMKALKKSYDHNGGGTLFWCGYKDKPMQSVENLILDINKNNYNRKAFYIQAKGFDETLLDIANLCFEDDEFRLKLQDIINTKKNRDIDLKGELIDNVKPVSNTQIILQKDEQLVSKLNDNIYNNELIIACLVGSWDENNIHDKIILTQIAGLEYEKWIGKLRDILRYSNSPVSFKNGVWKIKDRKNLWKTLTSRIFDDHLERVKGCAINVLSELNPKFDLPQNDQFAAQVYGKVLNHSSYIRKGLSESLALISNNAHLLINCSTGKPNNTVSLAIRKIFDKSNWVLWASLNDLLPVLTEAAPDEIIKIIDENLKKEDNPFEILFNQEESGLTGWNYITGLLWSLETLAWEDIYISFSVLLLGKLASIDPGGGWSNRPSNSLTMIFLPWLPQTTASFEKRKAAIIALEREFPEITWKLLLTLIPHAHQVSFNSRKPIFRDQIFNEWTDKISTIEYWEQVNYFSEKLIDYSKENFDKLISIIPHLENLPPHSFEKYLLYISDDIISNLPDEKRVLLWDPLMDITNKHRKYFAQPWALKPELISKIDPVLLQLQPKNIIIKSARLFTNRDADLYEDTGNWEEQQRIVDKKRHIELEKVLSEAGIKGILNLLSIAKSPSKVGESLGSFADDTIDKVLFPMYLNSSDHKIDQFIKSYIFRKYFINKSDWVDTLISDSWSKEQIAYFLNALPFILDTWIRVSNLLNDSDNLYWESVYVNPYHAEGDLNLAISNLIQFDRPFSALSCIYKLVFDKKELESSTIFTALINALNTKESPNSMDTHHITEIIKYLQTDSSVNEDYVCDIEWAYLSLFYKHSGVLPIKLNYKLASNSKYFCKVIRLVYRPKNFENSDIKDLSEKDQSVVKNAWQLLFQWSTPPGLQKDDTFNENKFIVWLTEVRLECEKTGHLEVALQHIGKVLYFCPADLNGFWINKSVASELNKSDSDELRRGFSMAVYNSRGFHWVDPGGKPELELAEKYRKRAEETDNEGYPRFASILRQIAESYEAEAKRNSDQDLFESQ